MGKFFKSKQTFSFFLCFFFLCFPLKNQECHSPFLLYWVFANKILRWVAHISAHLMSSITICYHYYCYYLSLLLLLGVFFFTVVEIVKNLRSAFYIMNFLQIIHSSWAYAPPYTTLYLWYIRAKSILYRLLPWEYMMSENNSNTNKSSMSLSP